MKAETGGRWPDTWRGLLGAAAKAAPERSTGMVYIQLAERYGAEVIVIDDDDQVKRTVHAGRPTSPTRAGRHEDVDGNAVANGARGKRHPQRHPVDVWAHDMLDHLSSGHA